jgi:hypothetical protein
LSTCERKPKKSKNGNKTAPAIAAHSINTANKECNKTKTAHGKEENSSSVCPKQ